MALMLSVALREQCVEAALALLSQVAVFQFTLKNPSSKPVPGLPRR